MKPRKQPSQARHITRLQERAEQTIDKFLDSYINKMADPDVSTEDLQKHLEWLDNRWRTFCHLQKFGAEAFSAFEDHIKKLYEQVKPEEPQPDIGTDCGPIVDKITHEDIAALK